MRTNIICRTAHYLTTPIFYVNSTPHIGHIYTAVVSDAINRFQRLRHNNQETIFSSGTDEHGLKIQTAAELEKIDTKSFCDLNSSKFRNLFIDSFNLTITDFIRTTEHRHVKAVQHLWSELSDRGYIHKGSYSGWYCTSDECFVPESQIQPNEINGTRVDSSNKPVHWLCEENYLFKLDKVKHKVLSWLQNSRPIKPDKFNEEAIQMLQHMTIDDISISRPKERVSWAISVPNDSNHSIYVWLDALTNYLTVAGYPCKMDQLKRWPIDCQIIGKDILKFHGIIWPAVLIALELPLPKRIICHSHWLVGNEKMSKSLGNGIDVLSEAQMLTLEGLRYYLLRAGTPHADTNYNRDQAIQRINSELANTYGNLLGRACSLKINPNQEIPCILSEKPHLSGISQLEARLKDLKSICTNHMEQANFYKSIEEVMDMLRLTNQVYEKAQPWNLVKSSDSRYYDLQTITFEAIRISSILLNPVIPQFTSKVLDYMDVKERGWADAELNIDQKFGRKLRKDIPKPTFARIG